MLVKFLRSEPAFLTGLVQVAIALVVAFGLTLSQGQTAAILGVAAFISAQLVRASVTPTTKPPA